MTCVGSVSMSRLHEHNFPSVDAVTKLFELATPTTWVRMGNTGNNVDPT